MAAFVPKWRISGDFRPFLKEIFEISLRNCRRKDTSGLGDSFPISCQKFNNKNKNYKITKLILIFQENFRYCGQR